MNPDVTVRSRGVMEKCTFCIQIESALLARNLAHADKRIADGTVITACQEVCPTKAISFGDKNDPNSEVSKHLADKRGYKVLDFIGVGPSITYLAKIEEQGLIWLREPKKTYTTCTPN